MAAIPPFHEEPPVGTNNATPVPSASHQQRADQPAPADQPADQPEGPAAAPPPRQAPQSPPLPADWSPVAPGAPADAP
jgi:hypothetical protein